MLLRRKSNRRVVLARQAFFLGLSRTLGRLVRALTAVGKVGAVLACVGGAAWASQQAVSHVVASPRFALREIRMNATHHVSRGDLVALAGVVDGDRLLTLDTDRIAARLATHPFVAAAHVRRELPSTLVIEVQERQPTAVALMGGFYLVDEAGHAFKRADLDESAGLPVLTGIDRAHYAAARPAAEAAFREALEIASAWRGAPGRPPLAEIHIEPENGFSAFVEGGVEVLLGRGAVAEKLARYDAVRASLAPAEALSLTLIHLEEVTGGPRDRVPVLLAEQ